MLWVNAVNGILSGVASLVNRLPSIPSMPDSVTDVLDTIVDMFGSGVSILSAFVDLSLVAALLSAVFVIINFEAIWRGLKRVLHLLPFVDIDLD